jgi:hypothetical protein
MAQEVILIIGIPNVACNGVKQVTKAVGIQKKFMYIHYVKRMQLICSKMDGYYHAQRPLGHQNIELLPEPYFHVVLLYPIVLILWRYQPKIVYTPCLKRHGKRCNNLAKPKKFRQE